MSQAAASRQAAFQFPKINGVGKWIGLILAIVAVIYGYGKLTARVEANTKDIGDLKTEMKEDIAEVKADIKLLLMKNGVYMPHSEEP